MYLQPGALWNFNLKVSKRKFIFMASIDLSIKETRRRGVKRQKKIVPRIDMTPMVDLGFLLIAFFVMTAQLSDPVVVKLNMPTEKGQPMDLANSDALTVLLTGNNNAWYYHGDWEKAEKENAIFKTNFSPDGLRKIIIEKKKRLAASERKEGADGMMMLIKAKENADYKSIVDILDEVMINAVKKYALIKLEPEEADWIRKQQ